MNQISMNTLLAKQKTLPNFWAQTHPLSEKSQELSDALMPVMGMADTLQGELIRASSKIAYDWYNNGWGCNNWSGAVVFLRANLIKLSIPPSDAEMHAFTKALDVAYCYSPGEPCSIDGESANIVCTKIHETVIKAVLNNPIPIKNRVDMLSLSESDHHYQDRYNEHEYDDSEFMS